MNISGKTTRLVHAIALVSLSSLATMNAALASEDGASTCTDVAIERANTLFGATENGVAASDMTTCLKKRHNIKALVAWNNDIAVSNNNSLQVINARNMMNDWDDTYNMDTRGEHDVVIVAYGKGGRWTMNNAAYNKKFGTDNPGHTMVRSLIERGAKIYMCQNSMKGGNLKVTDLIDGVHMVPSGASALVDFQYQGYTYIAP